MIIYHFNAVAVGGLEKKLDFRHIDISNFVSSGYTLMDLCINYLSCTF